MVEEQSIDDCWIDVETETQTVKEDRLRASAALHAGFDRSAAFEELERRDHPADGILRQAIPLHSGAGLCSYACDPDERDAVNSHHASTPVLERIERPVDRGLLEIRVDFEFCGIAHRTAPHIPRWTYQRLVTRHIAGTDDTSIDNEVLN